MKKKIPKLKRAIVDFLTKEDAKIVESKVAKVALSIGFALTTYYNILKEVNAFSFCHHSTIRHTNEIRPEDHLGVNYENTKKVLSEQGYTVRIQPKSIYEIHGHHVNHEDGGGSS